MARWIDSGAASTGRDAARAATQHAFGGPDVLEITEIAAPLAIPTDVLIRLHAIGVHPIEEDDLKLRPHTRKAPDFQGFR